MDPSRQMRQVEAVADKLLQGIARPDRPLEPETWKKPWLAALLSLVLVGAGQLYNRQLVKALALFLIFYVAGAICVLLYVLLGWMLSWEFLHESVHAVVRRLRQLDDAFLMIWAGLWLFAAVDACRTAAALRAGRLLVRYGFLRQGGFAIVNLVPFLGALTPSETVAPDDADESVRKLAGELARKRLMGKFVVPIVRIGCLVLGALLLFFGIYHDVHAPYTAGVIVVLAGLVLFVV